MIGLVSFVFFLFFLVYERNFALASGVEFWQGAIVYSLNMS